MQKQNNNPFEKEFTLKDKLLTYLKGLIRALVINCAAAGAILVAGHFAFQWEFSTGAYSNSMFAIGVLYMLYCYAVAQGDLYSRVDSSNLEITSTRFGRRGSSQMILDRFTRGESIMIVGSYVVATLGIAYLFAII